MIHPWQQLYQIGLQRHIHIGKHSPGSVAKKQAAWLHNCLQRNKKSAYGQQFQFEQIQTVKQFCNQVPLVTYQDVEPWIERVANGEKNLLFEGTPILFERTGGSTGGSKLIPYSAASLTDFQTAILPWLADVIKFYHLTSGCAYWAISPAVRATEKTGGGIPVGTSDGVYLGDEAMQPFRLLSAVPFWVAEITNLEEWRLATLYWLVRKSNLELISVWSPTFFTTLIEGLEQHQESLKSLLHNGGKIASHRLDPDAEALQRLRRYSENRDTRILWPNLKLVSCWRDASSKPFYEELVHQLPQAQFQGKGLLSTEGVVTIPNQDGHAELAINAGFYEFLDNDGHAWLPQELNLGETYQVVITTSGGLYRYCTGDYVICEKKKTDLPMLRFIGRLGLCSDLVGEKLTDAFVTKCLEGIPGFRLLVPILTAPGTKPKYGLVIDESNNLNSQTMAEQVEKQLKLNPQYAYARNIGQLDPLAVYQVHAPLEIYMKWAIKNGTRMGDIKVPSLRPETDWLDTFSHTNLTVF